MAYYISAATTTVSSSSVEILAADSSERADILVGCADAGVWVNFLGGAASVSGVNCIHIPQNKKAPFALSSGHAGLKAIRDDSTDAEVWVAEVGAGMVG